MATSTNQPETRSTAPPVTIQKVLTGQKALVTGANSGIGGEAVAIALGEAGADVVINYVDGDEAAAAVVDKIHKFDAKAYAHKADVSSEEEASGMFRRMMQQFGTIEFSSTMPDCSAIQPFGT